MKYFLYTIFFIVICCAALFPQDSSIIKLKKVADAVLKDAAFSFIDEKSGIIYNSTTDVPADVQLKPVSAYNDWRYWNGVLNIAMIQLSEVLNEEKYADFSIKNVEFGFNNYLYFKKNYKDENKWSYPFGQFFIIEELDDCGAIGGSVIEVYNKEMQARYLDYIGQAADHMLKKQARLEDGTFVRHFPVKWTLWADDLYMSISFLARMGTLTGEMKYFEDAAMQVINFHKYLFNDDKGIMSHCWYSDLKVKGAAYWGRANGWAMLAQADLLDNLPEKFEMRDTLISLLQRHIRGIAQYQGSEGLWHQLLDKPDSYLETSCSAMFTYAVARAVNRGYIDSRYASIAIAGWEGIKTRINEDGLVEGVCTGTVVSNDLVYYYNRPAPLNDVHGIGTIILAGTEVLRMNKLSK